jgi:hypothetical protein
MAAICDLLESDAAVLVVYTLLTVFCLQERDEIFAFAF